MAEWRPNPVFYVLPIIVLGVLIGYGFRLGWYSLSAISAGCIVWVMGAYVHRFLPASERYGDYSTSVYMVCIFVGFAIVIWGLTLPGFDFSGGVQIVQV